MLIYVTCEYEGGPFLQASQDASSEDDHYDPHLECQECYYFYRYVLNRVLEVEIPRSVRFKQKRTANPPEEQLFYRICDEPTDGVLRLVEFSWRRVMLLPILPVSPKRPFPSLQYLAKLTLWENLRDKFNDPAYDFDLYSLPIPHSLIHELLKFMECEEHSMREHLGIKFRDILCYTDYLQNRIYH